MSYVTLPSAPIRVLLRKRHASPPEVAVCLMELSYLTTSGELDTWTQRELADRWSCSPGRARRLASQLMNHLRTLDGPVANQGRTTLTQSFPHLAKTDGPGTDPERTQDGPSRARPLPRSTKPKVKLCVREAHEVYSWWRGYHPRAMAKPTSSDLNKISQRVRESSQQDCILLVEWIHTAPDASFWRDKRKCGISTIFKADKFGDRLESAQAWAQLGRPDIGPPAKSTGTARPTAADVLAARRKRKPLPRAEQGMTPRVDARSVDIDDLVADNLMFTHPNSEPS